MEASEQQSKEVQLYEEAHLQRMVQWYDQQIVLAGKSRELAEIKSAMAKARAEEMFAIVQMAKMTGEEPAGNGEKGD